MRRFGPGFALAFCVLASPALAQSTDARSGWKAYAWQRIPLADCSPLAQERVCPPYHEKWDWKRNQWVDVAVSFRPGAVDLTQRLTNSDRHDEDFVCVTAIVMDEEGQALAIHHQNWHSAPGEVSEARFSYAMTTAIAAAQLVIGSRQCRKGGHEDDAVYARALSLVVR